jgi:hypothetical protein
MPTFRNLLLTASIGLSAVLTVNARHVPVSARSINARAAGEGQDIMDSDKVFHWCGDASSSKDASSNEKACAWPITSTDAPGSCEYQKNSSDCKSVPGKTSTESPPKVAKGPFAGFDAKPYKTVADGAIQYYHKSSDPETTLILLDPNEDVLAELIGMLYSRRSSALYGPQFPFVGKQGYTSHGKVYNGDGNEVGTISLDDDGKERLRKRAPTKIPFKEIEAAIAGGKVVWGLIPDELK